jgi:hypothetical protein
VRHLQALVGVTGKEAPMIDYREISVAEVKRDALEEVINYLGLALEAMESAKGLDVSGNADALREMLRAAKEEQAPYDAILEQADRAEERWLEKWYQRAVI